MGFGAVFVGFGLAGLDSKWCEMIRAAFWVACGACGNFDSYTWSDAECVEAARYGRSVCNTRNFACYTGSGFGSRSTYTFRPCGLHV